MTLRFGSLFSGCGGMDLGLERAGMKCVWQVEIDDYCRRVLAKHWPDVRRHDDVRTFPPAGEWGCDLIAGGFPCQPVSVAGRRQAERDPRWLWPHFARTIRQLGPRYVLVENVPGLLLPGSGGLGILADFAEMGFDAEWATLPASAFGAPHLRERVFIVAFTQEKPGVGNGGRHQTRRQNAKAAKRLEKSSAASDRDRDRAQARVFRAGREIAALPNPCWGSDQPGVARTSYGTTHRVDRIEAIGNAVVPAVAEWVGKRILESAP